MDTSKEYIKMCEKAVEIQEAWKPHIGDWSMDNSGFCDTDDPRYGGLTLEVFGRDDGQNLVSSLTVNHIKSNFIWLPRQDQLQAMVDLSHIDRRTLYDPEMSDTLLRHWLFHKFISTYSLTSESPANIFDTLEQLWLAFVMKEEYNKVWNGEDWVKERVKE